MRQPRQARGGKRVAIVARDAPGSSELGEGALQDAKGDFTEDPSDDMAGKAKKVEGKIQEGVGRLEKGAAAQIVVDGPAQPAIYQSIKAGRGGAGGN